MVLFDATFEVSLMHVHNVTVFDVASQIKHRYSKYYPQGLVMALVGSSITAYRAIAVLSGEWALACSNETQVCASEATRHNRVHCVLTAITCVITG